MIKQKKNNNHDANSELGKKMKIVFLSEFWKNKQKSQSYKTTNVLKLTETREVTLNMKITSLNNSGIGKPL